MTGEGCLEWADQSWYEGEMRNGFRHGLGLYVQTPSFYCGNWRCGLRHGVGSMFYNRDQLQQDYYSGDWVQDKKQGMGLRDYPSGSLYSGQWMEGQRHGLGTMVWINNDVYSGNWERGEMQGYGEYTWSTFMNKQLVVPQENCFYGNWKHGVRDGSGTLETNLGVTVRGSWKDNKKHGAAEVVCSNGCFVYGDNLFIEDCIAAVPESNGREPHSRTTSLAHQLYKVPVNAASHDINIKFYVDQMNEYILECARLGKHFNKPAVKPMDESHSFEKMKDIQKSTDVLDCSLVESEMEENYVRDIIKQYMSVLKVIYIKYSEMCCVKKPDFTPVMMRLMFWQLLRDCGLHNRGYSLADFDILIANNKVTLVQGVHYPFERLQFWQFLHCLLEVSWQLYGRRLYKRDPPDMNIPGVLASALYRLITRDILPFAGQHAGSALKAHRNLLSLDSVYWLYRGMGEPLLARSLLKSVFLPQEKRNSVFQNNDQLPLIPKHLRHGTNVIGVGGKMTYLPNKEPFLPATPLASDSNHPRDLTCLQAIGLPAVFECIVSICPSVAFDNLVVNMDYQLVFLEFYEIILLCARLQVIKNHPPTPKASEVIKTNQENELVQGKDMPIEETISTTTKKKSKASKPAASKKKNKT